MDQLKEILQQAIKYRFWIVVGIACLLPVIAFAVTSGALDKQTSDEAAKIKSAYEGVKTYTSGKVPNEPYKKAVEEQTTAEGKQVDAAWRKLYERQAPLLQWPEEVADTIPKWGQKWPEGADPRIVRDAIEFYIRTYPDFVHKVYETFHPWNPEDGSGIVVAPPEPELMRPSPFDPNKPPLPELGEVWAAQQKLWAQGAVLDVIAKVNDQAKAKNWEQAPVKQINSLDVASPTALDQRSISRGDQLDVAPEISDPSKPKEEEAAPADASGGGGGQMEAMMKGGMGAMGGPMGGGMGAAGQAEEVYFLKVGDGNQYKVVPILLSVMIDQARIPDLLVAMQNSPMGIQPLEFELLKESRVQKPKVGEQLQLGGMGGMGMMGMMGMRGGGVMGGGMSRMMAAMGGRGGMAGYPGMAGGSGGYPGMGGGDMGSYMRGAMGGMPGMGGDTGPSRKGKAVTKNLESRSKKKKDQSKEETAKEEYEPKLSDPYFNVVELRVYGQARFYLPPPPPEEATSESANAPEAEKVEDEGEAAAKEEMAEPSDETTKKDEAAKKDEAGEPKAGGEAAGKAEPEKAEGAAAEPDGAAKPKDDAAAEGEAQEKDSADKPQPEGEAPKR